MALLDQRIERISRGGPVRALALAAACAERALPVFDNYWVGLPSDAPRNAIERAWKIVEGGSVPRSDWDADLAELADLTAFYYEEGIGVLAYSVTAALRVAQAATAELPKDSFLAAARACTTAVSLAISVDAIVGDGSTAADEEKTWVDGALAVLEARSEVGREMFRSLGPAEPGWWARYQACERHL